MSILTESNLQSQYNSYYESNGIFAEVVKSYTELEKILNRKIQANKQNNQKRIKRYSEFLTSVHNIKLQSSKQDDTGIKNK